MPNGPAAARDDEHTTTMVVGGSLWELLGGLLLTPTGGVGSLLALWAVLSDLTLFTGIFALLATAILAYGLFLLFVRKQVAVNHRGGATVTHTALGIPVRTKPHSDGTYDFVRVRDLRHGRLLGTNWKQAMRDQLQPQFAVELYGVSWTEDLGRHWSRVSALTAAKRLSEATRLDVYDVSVGE